MDNVTMEAKGMDGPSVAAANMEANRVRTWLMDRILSARHEPVTEIVTITPELAEVMLERNDMNRPISRVQVGKFARDITNGRWSLNGEAIIIARDGELNDGQHRLLAVVKAGIPIRTNVVFGVERASRMTVDIGNARLLGHFLGMTGHTNVAHLSAMANFVWQWCENGTIKSGSKSKPNKTEAIELVSGTPEMADSLAYVSRPGAASVVSWPILGFAHWAIWHSAKAGRVGADNFIDKLITGAGLDSSSVILNLRNRLIEMKQKGRTDAATKIEMIFRAWNIFRSGREVAHIRTVGNLPELEG